MLCKHKCICQARPAMWSTECATLSANVCNLQNKWKEAAGKASK